VAAVKGKSPGEDAGSLVEIGRIGRPHGVRGAITFLPHNPDSELLLNPPDLYFDDRTPVPVAALRPAPRGRYVLEIEGVDDREAAAALTHRALFVLRSDLPEPEEGLYLVDLVGLSVEDPGGRPLGRITGLIATGGVDVLEIEGEGGPWMLPAADALIVEVDAEGGRLVVDPPDGLVPGTEGV
jgi:16S rRNA processing protein RimM